MLRVVVEWTDEDLGWLRTAWNQVTGSTSAGLLTALLAHSTGACKEHVEGTRVVVAGTPPGGNFPSVSSVATLTFCTTSNTLVRLQLPAPAAAIVLPGGGREIDSTLIGDIITAAIGTLTDDSGTPVAAYAGGIVTSRRKDQD